MFFVSCTPALFIAHGFLGKQRWPLTFLGLSDAPGAGGGWLQPRSLGGMASMDLVSRVAAIERVVEWLVSRFPSREHFIRSLGVRATGLYHRVSARPSLARIFSGPLVLGFVSDSSAPCCLGFPLRLLFPAGHH